MALQSSTEFNSSFRQSSQIWRSQSACLTLGLYSFNDAFIKPLLSPSWSRNSLCLCACLCLCKRNLRPPGGGGHGEQGEEQEGGVEQGEEVGVGSGPELRRVEIKHFDGG